MMATTRKLLIQFGDGGSPETFAHNCSINTNREVTYTTEFTEWDEPDCDDLDGPSVRRRAPSVLDSTISGAGTTDPESYETLFDKWLAGEPINCRIKIDEPGASGGFYTQAAYYIASIGQAKEGKGVVTFSIELSQDGTLTKTANA
jgi:hypothetical protein